MRTWPPELFMFFGGFLISIGMHYWMAWKVNRTRTREQHIEVRRNNYRKVYRAYRKEIGGRWAPLLSLIGFALVATGFIAILLEST